MVDKLECLNENSLTALDRSWTVVIITGDRFTEAHCMEVLSQPLAEGVGHSCAKLMAPG